MTRDEIYDHLAQVYLGKRKKVEEKRKKQFNAWLLINIFITIIIFSSAIYGLSAFLVKKDSLLRNNIIYSLHRGPIQVEYNFRDSFPPVKSFVLNVPAMDASKYNKLQFSIRGKEEGNPGIIKVVLKNKKNEMSSYYIRGIGLDWQEYDIPLEDFYQISDWTNLTDISFILEAWNVDDTKGIVLIEEVNFSS